MSRIITVANQKGGVTKSVVCQHLSRVLADKGFRTLAVDMDPQINLTMSLACVDVSQFSCDMNTLLGCLLEEQPLPPTETYIAHSNGVDFIAGSKLLYRQESTLRLEMGSERFLASILSPLRTSYDYIIIDTNRADSPLLINALTAADSVLIPVCPSFYSTEGLSDLVATVLKNRRRLNPSLAFEGILFSNCNLRTRLYRETRFDVEAAFGGEMPIFQTAIPHTVQVEEAVRRGMTVMEYDPISKASTAFRALGEEVIAHASQNTRPEAPAEYGGNQPQLRVG